MLARLQRVGRACWTTFRPRFPRSRVPSSCRTKPPSVGFDWPSLGPVFDKLKEELAELEEVVAGGGRGMATARKIEEEFGDLLFVVANVARHLKVDPEAALRSANQKFVPPLPAHRELLAAGGRTPAQSTLAEMDRLWDQAKAEERRA